MDTNININVEINAPGVIESVLALADVMEQLHKTITKSIQEGGKISLTLEQKSERGNKENQIKETPIKEESIVPIEQVRAKLALLTQLGKQKQVKALIEKYGAKKLTDINQKYYQELLKDAAEL